MAPTGAVDDPPVEIRPQPGPQETFLSSPADIAIAGGAAGVGKTWALLLEPVRHIDNGEFGAVFFRRESPQITNIGGLWDESAKIYPLLGAVPRRNTLEWEFPTGARVKFSHMQYEHDREAWAGAQVPLINFDQLEQFTEGQFWFMNSRNRSMCGVRPYIRGTCNPVPDDDPTGGWLHRLIAWWLDEETGYPRWDRSGHLRWFVRLDEQIHWADSREALLERFKDRPAREVLPKSLTFIPGTLEHNRILLAVNPEYRASLLAMPLVERERLLGGNWKIKPSAGKVFNRAWFETVAAVPAGGGLVRYWDKAGTEGGGAYTAGVLMLKAESRFYVIDVVRGQWSAMQRENVILQTAKADHQKYAHRVSIWVEEEPGSGGKESAETTIRMLAGYDVRKESPRRNKVERAQPMSAQAEAGNVKLLQGEWNEAFLREAHGFEEDAPFKDQVDAAAGAFNKLTLWNTNAIAAVIPKGGTGWQRKYF